MVLLNILGRLLEPRQRASSSPCLAFSLQHVRQAAITVVAILSSACLLRRPPTTDILSLRQHTNEVKSAACCVAQTMPRGVVVGKVSTSTDLVLSSDLGGRWRGA